MKRNYAGARTSVGLNKAVEIQGDVNPGAQYGKPFGTLEVGGSLFDFTDGAKAGAHWSVCFDADDPAELRRLAVEASKAADKLEVALAEKQAAKEAEVGHGR